MEGQRDLRPLEAVSSKDTCSRRETGTIRGRHAGERGRLAAKKKIVPPPPQKKKNKNTDSGDSKAIAKGQALPVRGKRKFGIGNVMVCQGKGGKGPHAYFRRRDV